MAALTRSEQILIEKTVCVLLLRGMSPEGTAIYAYLGVRADRLQAFMEAQQQGNFQPEDYGVVIASGTGEPDADTQARMERDYGFSHRGMMDVPEGEGSVHLAIELSKRTHQA